MTSPHSSHSYPQQPYGQQPYGQPQPGQPPQFGQPQQPSYGQPPQNPPQALGQTRTGARAGAIVCGASAPIALTAIATLPTALISIFYSADTSEVLFLVSSLLMLVAAGLGIPSGALVFRGRSATPLAAISGVTAVIGSVLGVVALFLSANFDASISSSIPHLLAQALEYVLIVTAGVLNIVMPLRSAPRSQTPENLSPQPIQPYGYPS